MSKVQNTRIAYFTAGEKTTNTELAEIDRLEYNVAPRFDVVVYNALFDCRTGYGDNFPDIAGYAGSAPSYITDAEDEDENPMFADYSNIAENGSETGFALYLFPNEYEIADDGEIQLSAVFVGANGVPTEVTASADIDYASDTPGAATVSSAGLVSGVDAGTATIEATYEIGDDTYTASVTIDVVA